MTDRTPASERANHGQWTEEYDNEIHCPWCESTATRLVSPYGPSVAEMLFKCRDCGQGFGWMKWRHRLPS